LIARRRGWACDDAGIVDSYRLFAKSLEWSAKMPLFKMNFEFE